MGAAQDRARTKNQLVTARKLLSQFFPDPSPAIITCTHPIDSKMSRPGCAFLRIFPHYGEARTNRADRVGLIWVICLESSTSYCYSCTFSTGGSAQPQANNNMFGHSLL